MMFVRVTLFISVGLVWLCVCGFAVLVVEFCLSLVSFLFGFALIVSLFLLVWLK